MALPLNVNIVIIAIVFSLLPIVIVVMRFRARVLQGAKLGLDDYMILPALVRNYPDLLEPKFRTMTYKTGS
jgi:hypothetical protein